MIAFYASLGLGVLLVLVLFILGSGRETPGGETDTKLKDSRGSSCPPEIVQQLFSKRDLTFVSGIGSRWLERFYVSERRRIATEWTRRTSWELARAMRDHLHAARERHDIEAATEAKLLLQYAGLRCLYGFLRISTQLVRPSLLQEFAVYTSRVSQRIGAAKGELEGVRKITPRRVASGF